MNRKELKRKLRKIENLYSKKMDFFLLESLASCAIEGNPMYNRVGYVMGYIWGLKKEPPTDLMIDSVLDLFIKLNQKKLKLKGV